MSMPQNVVAGTVGGLAGGLAMTAFMSVGEASGLLPDPLPLKFNRKFEEMAGVEGQPSPVQEHALALGEHLLVSAGFGAAYGALNELLDLEPLPSGPLFGLGVFAVMLGGAGPAMGVTKEPWNEKPTTVARRMMMHAVYGTLTAVVANQVRKRLA